MNPELVRRFHEAVRDEAARRYGLDPSDLTELRAFENYVYESENEDGVGLVLRLSHSTRRTFDYTQGEIEFVRYLGAAKVPLPQPGLVGGGAFRGAVAHSDPGHHFVVTAFERAEGIVFDEA